MGKRQINHFAHLLPMPLAPLLACPALISAEGPVYRAATVLAIVYWMTGCRPLPTDNTSIAALVRIPTSHATLIRSALDTALAELLPMLAAEYVRAHKSRAGMRAIALNASRVAHGKDRQTGKSFTDAAGPARTKPVKSSLYRGSGRTDMAARQDAIERDTVSRATTPPRSQGLLSEGHVAGRK